MLEKLAGLVAGRTTRFVTLVAWIVAAVWLSIALPQVGDHEKNNALNLEADSPSVQAERIMKQYFPTDSGIPALIVWHREGGLTEGDFEGIRSLSSALAAKPLEAQQGSLPLHEMPATSLLRYASEDGSTLVQPVTFAELTETGLLKQNLASIQSIIREQAGSDPFAVPVDDESELSVRITGPVGISVDATDLFMGADVSLLIATVLLVLILLLLIYRSPILAVVPLVGVGFAYGVTSPLLGWMAREGWITVDAQAISIMTVLLFGAGTDYCLFFISHFRQELLREHDKTKALKQAFKDSSGAIAMSGFTVVLSLFALLAAKYGAYHRFAVPFSLSILIMGIASLTLIPALLAIFGRASFFPFVPRTEAMEQARAAKTGKPHRSRAKGKATFGSKIGQIVVARPWTVVISCVLVLGLLAGFTPQIKYTYDLLSSFPEDMPSREGFSVISEAFAQGDLAPVTVIVRMDEAGLPGMTDRLAALPIVDHVREPQLSPVDPQYAAFAVVLNDNPYSGEAMEAIPRLFEAAESALAIEGSGEPAKNVWIAGQTAAQYDARELTNRDNGVIMPLVVLLIMILLLAYLRSVTATAYLIATVLLSYGAALGLGWIILHEWMGAEAIQGAIPLYAFVFLIALGEDYNIFMISSIWNKRRTMPLRQAIKEGVSDTGGVITSAGLILAATFAVLATLPIQVLVQFGVITAIGVLMDTFIVRPLLVPAVTALLGNRAFWPGKAGLADKPEQTAKAN
ncbi:MMPL family transporter [Paenibacillus arenilitoris]|uniref:MMPL family transporter n=1 Tax=Paenibacillus arenilitoris TaxID=2772299 RepID=A0A927CPK4_9BACL|nr:MMPL family transporter [Paenibacillus arenilitoris]MBD2871170.1 MMPL family transporter [Paenibacillus arenilitoris]